MFAAGLSHVWLHSTYTPFVAYNKGVFGCFDLAALLRLPHLKFSFSLFVTKEVVRPRYLVMPISLPVVLEA